MSFVVYLFIAFLFATNRMAWRFGGSLPHLLHTGSGCVSRVVKMLVITTIWSTGAATCTKCDMLRAESDAWTVRQATGGNGWDMLGMGPPTNVPTNVPTNLPTNVPANLAGSAHKCAHNFAHKCAHKFGGVRPQMCPQFFFGTAALAYARNCEENFAGTFAGSFAGEFMGDLWAYLRAVRLRQKTNVKLSICANLRVWDVRLWWL